MARPAAEALSFKLHTPNSLPLEVRDLEADRTVTPNSGLEVKIDVSQIEAVGAYQLRHARTGSIFLVRGLGGSRRASVPGRGRYEVIGYALRTVNGKSRVVGIQEVEITDDANPTVTLKPGAVMSD